jgi:hypothetical protein
MMNMTELMMMQVEECCSLLNYDRDWPEVFV